MPAKDSRNQAKPKRGRPEKMMKFDGSPEELAQAIFARAKPPDPSKRIHTSKSK